MQSNKFTVSVLLFLALVLGLTLLAIPAPVTRAAMPPAAPTPGDIHFAGGLRFGNGSTSSGYLYSDGTIRGTGLTTDYLLTLSPGTTISVTNSGTFTPTASFQPIQSGGTVTPTLSITNTAGALYATGTVLRLLNLTNTTINLADSGTVKLSAAWAGGQYDSLMLMFDGNSSTWIEMSRTDN